MQGCVKGVELTTPRFYAFLVCYDAVVKVPKTALRPPL